MLKHLCMGNRLFGEPLFASKSSNVVPSGITFTALDLITRPSPLRATMCSSAGKRFLSHVPRCHLSVMTPPGTFPASSEHHCCLEGQEQSSMLTSLQSLLRRSATSRHMAFVQDVRCVLGNPRKHRRVDGDRTPNSTRKIKEESLLSFPQLI